MLLCTCSHIPKGGQTQSVPVFYRLKAEINSIACILLKSILPGIGMIMDGLLDNNPLGTDMEKDPHLCYSTLEQDNRNERVNLHVCNFIYLFIFVSLWSICVSNNLFVVLCFSFS